MTEPTTLSLTLPNEAATAHLMADLALLLGAGDIITLSGDLGAGKTTAARAMIRYLADDEELEVPSPTFTLVQAYNCRPSRCCTPTSIGSAMPRSWKKSGSSLFQKAIWS